MVGLQKASKAIGFAAIVTGSFVLSTPLAAQVQPAPDIEQCKSLPREFIDDFVEIPDEDREITLPQGYGDTVIVSTGWMAVKTKAGTTHCVDLSSMYSATNFEKFGDRFIGFEWSGYEAGGYVLVDLAWTGSDIDTGAKPVFSPDGGLFAAVQLSDAGWGGLEGFGVWRALGSRMTPVSIDSALPYMIDWQIDGWEDESCIKLSAIADDQMGGSYEDMSSLPREKYVARYHEGFKIKPNINCSRTDEG